LQFRQFSLTIQSCRAGGKGKNPDAKAAKFAKKATATTDKHGMTYDETPLIEVRLEQVDLTLAAAMARRSAATPAAQPFRRRLTCLTALRGGAMRRAAPAVPATAATAAGGRSRSTTRPR
jgi:hypothetical protein